MGLARDDTCVRSNTIERTTCGGCSRRDTGAHRSVPLPICPRRVTVRLPAAELLAHGELWPVAVNAGVHDRDSSPSASVRVSPRFGGADHGQYVIERRVIGALRAKV